ncbi:endonuclease/exonuclease/phosphatase family protein [Clostridium sp.]|uniref:endonuclease/exonuclease/phosphatase family protein n=1 Tax=Clostridium sp. TaxID=1506 RepID=UPI0032169E76
MKIATYNVWNENKGGGNRFNQLINEINNVNADVIGLQEVTTHFFYDILTKRTDYEYCEFKKYEDEDEGLAILSRYPLENCIFLHTREEFAYSRALNVLFQVGKSRFSFTNVHLPWDSVKAQEDQIVAIDRYMNMQKGQADYIIMLGDFNAGINSSVHRYLLGEQTINGNESKPCWDELSSSFATLNDLPLQPTLDCINNPRWKGKNTMYVPSVMDRIYIMDNWVDKTLQSVRIFGTDISPENNLAASDHYGVVAEVDFIK